MRDLQEEYDNEKSRLEGRHTELVMKHEKAMQEKILTQKAAGGGN